MEKRLSFLTSKQKRLERLYIASLSEMSGDLCRVVSDIVEAIERKDMSLNDIYLTSTQQEPSSIEQILTYLEKAVQWPSTVTPPNHFSKKHDYLQKVFKDLKRHTRRLKFCLHREAGADNDIYDDLYEEIGFYFSLCVGTLDGYSDDLEELALVLPTI
ncbi:MAG: hypothetical protein ACI35P_15525 [Bacillus sp. (in: firmicutes)]